jgi:hypothetical protein
MKYKYTGVLLIAEQIDSIPVEVPFVFEDNYQMVFHNVKQRAISEVFQNVSYEKYTNIISVDYGMEVII